MKIVLAAARALALLGLLAMVPPAALQSDSTAAACSCAFPRTEAETRQFIDSAPLAVVAAIDTQAEYGLVMDVESVLNTSPVPHRIVIGQSPHAGFLTQDDFVTGPDCSVYLRGKPGTEYLLVADGETDGNYKLSMCSGTGPMERITSADDYLLLPGIESVIAENSFPTDDSAPLNPLLQEESEHETEDLPWVPIVIIALAIPLAVLLIPSFFGKGGSGGH